MRQACVLLLGLCLRADAASMTAQDNKTILLLKKTAADIIHDTNARLGYLEPVRRASRISAAYEIGYLYRTLHEYYRKQVDKYRVSKRLRTQLYNWELVVYLKEIEAYYWQIDHVANMMHEIERKYNISGSLDDDYETHNKENYSLVHVAYSPIVRKTRKKTKKVKWHFWKHILSRLSSTTKKRPSWWPLEYGWEIDYYW